MSAYHSLLQAPPSDRPARWRPQPTRYTCTRAQQRFWVLAKLEQGNPALNVAVRWALEGDVSAPLVEAAWQRVVARHEVLRTFFDDDDGEPVQCVEPTLDLPVPVVDLTALPEAEALAEAERLASVEARRPFNLGLAPLLRATLLRVRAERSVLLVTAHHIICDGWSIGLLAAEMGESYAALREGRTAILPDLPIQYGEFAEWQHETADAQDLAPSVAFWDRSLRGMKHFELLTDRPRLAVQTSNSEIVSILLDRDLTGRVAALAQLRGCSLFMTALAALLVLLRRQSGEDDIAIGTQVAGRDQVEVEALVGLFINTLVLRTDLSGQPSFLDLLARVRDTVSLAFEHRRVPLETLIEIARPDRDLSRNPLFSVNFIFQRSFVRNEQYADVRLVDMPSRSAGALYDLNFFMVERPDGWRASCEYNSDLFDRDTVAALLRRFETVLRAAAADPARPIADLRVLPEDERRHVLTTLRGPDVPYPRDSTVIDLFAAQVRRTPEAVAVVCGAKTLSFRALDATSDRLAGELRDRELAPGTRIGVMVDRSVELVVALLAVLKSGAAYVPLDPSYPEARIAHVLESGGVAAVITRSDLRKRVGTSGVPLVLVDAEPESRGARHPTAPGRPASPDDIAYVIFTSGSTGLPKGVQIGHRSLVNLLWAMRAQPGLSAEDTLVSVTTIAFDIAALEIFLPLIVGARLVIAREAETIGPALLGVLRRHRATAMQATPVTWQLLLDAGWHGDPKLKMLCGGEALPRPLATRLLETGGELWNMYGPTETTIWSSVLHLADEPGPVRIGPPIANTAFYVLDADGNLTPPGAPGELFIGGDGVAAAYFDRPDLTSERFVADPFTAPPGPRMYRTGDLVRLRAAGQLEFLGRTDHQIKLRGFRIELGEIEATILRHPAVTEAVAVVGRDPSGEPGIHAYAVVDTVTPLPQAELRTWLARTLPSYMLPSSIGILPALPRTPNGKIDRGALPALAAEPVVRVAHAEPTGDVQQRMAAIWRALLGVVEIEPSSNFFELGGNSLLAARLLARIETEFERRVSLAALFQSAGLQDLADLVAHPQHRAFEFNQVVKLQPAGARPPLLALNNTGIFYVLSRRLPAEQPLTALQLFDPSLDRGPPPQSFEAIAEEYVRLILRVQPAGPYALLGWCIAGAVALEAAHQLRARGHEVALVVMIDTWIPGYIRRLPRLRAMLANQSYRLRSVGADIRKLLTGRRSLQEFLSRRNAYNRLLRRAGQPDIFSSSNSAAMTEFLAGQRYHEKILGYLRAAGERYDPKPYDGRVILIRATAEPAGWFLDRALGWAPFMTGRFDNVLIEGDHSTIFQDPGVRQLSAIVSAAVAEAVSDAEPSPG